MKRLEAKQTRPLGNTKLAAARHAQRTLLALAALALLGCGYQKSAPSSRPSPDAPTHSAEAPAWGVPVASGLQMGVWLPAQSSAAACLIRNQGSRNVWYQDGLGYWEGVTVWARPAGAATWVRLERDRFVPRASEGIGFGISPLSPKPGGKLLSRADWVKKVEQLYHESRLIAVPEQTTPASETSTVVWKGRSYKTPRITPYTFTVFLKDFVWPDEWTGAVEIEVEQKLRSGPVVPGKPISYQDQPVRSGTVTLPAETVRSLRVAYPKFSIPLDASQSQRVNL